MESVSGVLWENLFALYLVIAVIVGALVLGWLTVSLVRFRARPGDLPPPDAPRAGVLPAERGRAMYSWVIALVIAAIMFGLAFSTIHAVDAIEHPPEGPDNLYLDVTGFQFGWRVTYTGTGGVPVVKTNEWTVPVDTPVVATVTSTDVWHNFALPKYRIRVDAIPGERNLLWFQAGETGEERPVCVQICGVGHVNMHGVMHVVSKDEFKTFLAAESERALGTLSARGLVFANVTDAGLTLEKGVVTPGRAVVLNVTNAGAQAVTVSVGDASIEVPAGGAGRLYVPPVKAGDRLEVVAGSFRQTLEVS